jgi:hypothetical protein
MYLYHYFEAGNSPFLTLSDLSDEQAKSTQDALKEVDNVYARRDYDGKYMYFRRIVENNVRTAFMQKGGKPVRQTPLYFILGESHENNNQSYNEWFKNPAFIEIPINKIDLSMVSFSYGDSFIVNHPEHCDQTKTKERVYTYDEICKAIKDRGWPQDCINDDSPFWVPRYIEAQVWSDEIIRRYTKSVN